MNQIPEEKKDSVTKTLAILGFIAVIILIVWLAVKVVALIPSAFSSLASIADSVYNNQSNKELTVSTKNSVVNSGESFTVSWTKMRGDGTYGFAYKCTDGVSVDIRKSSGAVETIDCATFIDLDNDTELDVLINTEKTRFTDIEYSITYTREGTENIVSNGIVTVVNTSIPTGVVVEDETEETTTSKPTETIKDDYETGTGSSDTPTYSSGSPTVVTNYRYEIPRSDPNGVVDLQVIHLGVGVVQGDSFIPLAQLDEDQGGAIRFEIKNIGTKTAEDWNYEADLPSDINYKSGDQKALKPNERVIITLGFDGITRTGTEQFGVAVDARGDVNKANNNYSWVVKVVN